MNKGKVKKIDFSRKRFAMLADKYYNQGKYFSALRMAMKEFDEYGGGGDVYARLSDIYEAMNLQGTAINWWFKFLHVATEADLPDVYEGLAINYLNLGNDSISAYYYNRLIDVDDTLPDETKLDIAEAFSTPKKSRFRFVYPPQIADFSQEVSKGSKSLKTGDLEQAIEEFSAVEKGSKQYPQAKEMQAVAYLLAGNTQDAESACNELLQEKPDDVRGLATLAAVYLEQGRKEESLEIAKRLAMVSVEDTDDIYKIATVCCENGLHEEAYKKFCILDQKLPFDGRTLYFKGVSAYKSGLIDEAEKTFATLCDVYPDAEVAKFYLKGIRNFKDGEEPAPELTYFYHLPEKEREARCETLMLIRNSAKDEAELFGMLADTQGYFRWCFDEMDGGDHELQYLGLLAAVHARSDEFVQDVLLDYEVADVLKIETLRMLLERNEEAEFGLVLCHIYRKVFLPRVTLGRKRRKKFIEAYAKLASKFIVIKDGYGEKIRLATETLYQALQDNNALDIIDNTDDCACAIFLLCGMKELGNDPKMIASAFDADVENVRKILAAASDDGDGNNEEKRDTNE